MLRRGAGQRECSPRGLRGRESWRACLGLEIGLLLSGLELPRYAAMNRAERHGCSSEVTPRLARENADAGDLRLLYKGEEALRIARIGNRGRGRGAGP